MSFNGASYGAAKKLVQGLASGFDHAEKTGDNSFKIFFKNGTSIELTIPQPEIDYDKLEEDMDKYILDWIEEHKDDIQGMSAYQSAVVGGYDKSEEEFYRELSDLATNKKVEEVKEEIEGEVGQLAEEIAEYDKELEKVKGRIEDAVTNTIDNPFDKAYWRDSTDGEVYLVELKNGVLFVSKPEDEITIDSDDLLEDVLLIWEDSFNGTTLNSSNWINREQGTDAGCNSPDCVSVQDGYVRLLSKYSPSPINFNGVDYNWQNARIETRAKHAFKYGTFEAKMRWKNAQAWRVAFWTDGNNYHWPLCGEIDIVETSIGLNNSTSNVSGLHYMGNNGHTEGVHSHHDITDAYTIQSVEEWLIYGCTYDSDGIETYIRRCNGGSRTSLGKILWSDVTDFALNYGTTNVFNPFKLIPQFLIFSTHALVDESELTTDTKWLDIDWVRAYALPNVTEKPTIKALQLTEPGGISHNDGDTFSISLANLLQYNGIKYIQFRYRYSDEDGNTITSGIDSNVFWESSDNTVIKVSTNTEYQYNSVIQALKKGTCTIKITDKIHNLSCSCIVTVTD